MGSLGSNLVWIPTGGGILKGTANVETRKQLEAILTVLIVALIVMGNIQFAKVRLVTRC